MIINEKSEHISVMQGRERIYDVSPQKRDGVPYKAKSEPIVGVVTWANDDRQAFTDGAAYASLIKEEIDFRATSGFSYRTLTKDPQTRKSIDDILYNLHGEDNPHDIEYYRLLPLQPENEQLAQFFSDLSNTQGLDSDVIKEAYKQGLLSDSVINSLKDCCFYGRYNTSSVAVFADPINALSHASINRLMVDDFQSIDRLVAGENAFSVLEKHLIGNPDIKNIVLCFDSGEAGTKAAMELKDKLYKAGYTSENGYHCERQIPTAYKDFNQFLVSCRDTLEGQLSLSRENAEEYEHES